MRTTMTKATLRRIFAELFIAAPSLKMRQLLMSTLEKSRMQSVTHFGHRHGRDEAEGEAPRNARSTRRGGPAARSQGSMSQANVSLQHFRPPALAPIRVAKEGPHAE